MRKILIASLVLLFSAFTIPSYGGEDGVADVSLSWSRTYGGERSDAITVVLSAADGGYIVAGNTQSSEGKDQNGWIMKLNADSSVAWTKSYGGEERDGIRSAQPTGDGGYLVGGYTRSYGAQGADAWIFKIAKNGETAWQTHFGGRGDDVINFVLTADDGNYVVGGETSSFGAGISDGWVVKLDPAGTVIWQRTYGGISNDMLNTAQLAAGGDFIVAGATASYGKGDGDGWMLKLHADGTIAWQRTYGAEGYDGINALIATEDGGYIAGGETFSSGAGGADGWVLKLDKNGNVVWQKTYGSAGDESVRAIRSVAGGYLAGGSTSSTKAGDVDGWMMKLNGDGDIAWQKNFGGAGFDSINAILPLVGNDYLAAGTSASTGRGGSDGWVLKLNGSPGASYSAAALAF